MASLDSANEMRVYRNIFKAFPSQTIILSTHSLHLLPMFDRIYMFEQGRIAGVGTVEKLLRECPQFKALWNNYTEESSQERGHEVIA